MCAGTAGAHITLPKDGATPAPADDDNGVVLGAFRAAVVAVLEEEVLETVLDVEVAVAVAVVVVDAAGTTPLPPLLLASSRYTRMTPLMVSTSGLPLWKVSTVSPPLRATASGGVDATTAAGLGDEDNDAAAAAAVAVAVAAATTALPVAAAVEDDDAAEEAGETTASQEEVATDPGDEVAAGEGEDSSVEEAGASTEDIEDDDDDDGVVRAVAEEVGAATDAVERMMRGST